MARSFVVPGPRAPRGRIGMEMGAESVEPPRPEGPSGSTPRPYDGTRDPRNPAPG
jgi:hypothetical protein